MSACTKPSEPAAPGWPEPVLAQQLALHMPSNGSILFFDNALARQGMPGHHAHAAAKTGLIAMATTGELPTGSADSAE